MFDSLGLVDFAIMLVNTVICLTNEQVTFLGNSNYRRTVLNPANQNKFYFFFLPYESFLKYVTISVNSCQM